ncbi:1,25-dihydroxyvitamin D(3) 24-hydroxylase, mitochondrial-like [Anneissia japonica]|uniref:1,25-dihydroxyvitamin D(3) 24-hydroxylase, mitochondrial-like n=1 Tax=Anneissia japonica TaxID=1529436 RepID=UPI0014258CB8|nr:1,25-dihydroxyvitamin D(3) 24-hydroxylase, mitochondrial-like [Anneissia japonica]
MLKPSHVRLAASRVIAPRPNPACHVCNRRSKSMPAIETLQGPETTYGNALTQTMKESVCSLTSNKSIGESTVNTEVKSYDEIPGPKGWPIIGSLLDYTYGPYTMEKMHLATIDRFRTYGKIYKENIAGQTAVHILEPKDVQKLFQSEGARPKRLKLDPMIHYRKRRKQNIGLANIEGEDWIKLRRPLNQTIMKPKTMESYLPTLDSVASDFVDHMKRMIGENGEIDGFYMEIYKWSLENSWAVVFDERLGGLRIKLENNYLAKNVIQSVMDFFVGLRDLTFGLPLYKLNIPTSTWKRFAAAQDYVFEISKKRIQEALQEEKTSEEAGFLESLTSHKDFTLEELTLLCNDVLIGSLDTTSHSVAFNLYTLAKNPEAQEKLYQEVINMTDKDEPIRSEHFQNIPYMKAFVKETFRMLPTTDGTSRKLDQDIVLSGYNIPADTLIRVHMVAGTMEEYVENPTEFRPERWLRESESKIDPHLLLPFGHGPRMCVGRRFAENAIYMLLAKIVRQFKVEWHHEDMDLHFRIVNTPSVPLKFKFVERT